MSKKRFYLMIFLFITLAVIISLVLFNNSNTDRLLKGNIHLSPDEKVYLENHRDNITYVNDPSYPPVSFLDSEGNYTGLNEDYIKIIESRLNVRFKRIYTKSWKEAMSLVKSGKVEIIGAIAATPERMKYLIFTPTLIKITTNFLIRKNMKNLTTRSDFRFKKVAVTESYAVEDYIRNFEPSITLVPVSNDLEGLKMVSSGELDAVACDLLTASYFIEQKGMTNLKIAAETGMEYNLCLGINRENTILASIMIKGVNSVTTEEFNNIRNKWIHLEFEPFVFGRRLWIAIAFLLTLIASGTAIFTIWTRLLSIKVNQKTRELNEYKDKLETLVDERTKKLQSTVAELNEALENVKTLRGLIPICSRCKKIRDDEGYWKQTEEFIRDHSDAEFSHSLCPNCVNELYGKEKWFRKK